MYFFCLIQNKKLYLFCSLCIHSTASLNTSLNWKSIQFSRELISENWNFFSPKNNPFSQHIHQIVSSRKVTIDYTIHFWEVHSKFSLSGQIFHNELEKIYTPLVLNTYSQSSWWFLIYGPCSLLGLNSTPTLSLKHPLFAPSCLLHLINPLHCWFQFRFYFICTFLTNPRGDPNTPPIPPIYCCT